MADVYRHFSDITIDREISDEGVYKLLGKLRPTWAKEDISIEVLQGGYMNKTLKALNKNNSDDGLIVRIDGVVPPKVGLSRQREIDFVRHLNSKGVGVPPLLASFNNGIVTKLISGVPVETDAGENIMSDKNFAREAARGIADIHHCSPEKEDPKVAEGNPDSLLRLAKNSLQYIRTELKDSELVKKYLAGGADFDDMEKEIESLHAELVSLKTPVGLTHNDIWHSNMLYEKDKVSVTFIDYEMMDIGFQPYDLGSYLLCLIGIPPDMSKKATPEFSKFFIRAYLERLAELKGNPASSVTELDVEKYFVWTLKCELLFMLFGSIYNFYIGCNLSAEHADFDVVGLCLLMYSEYKTQKENLKNI